MWNKEIVQFFNTMLAAEMCLPTPSRRKIRSRDCFKGSSIKVKWKWKKRQLGIKEGERERERTAHCMRYIRKQT